MLNYALRVNLTIAIVAMVEDPKANATITASGTQSTNETVCQKMIEHHT